MTKFSDLNIELNKKALDGDKINIMKLLNREITIHKYLIKPTKYPKEGCCPDCLHMEISVGEKKHVVFVGSAYLIKTIQKIPDDQFPIITTIVEENKRYQFT